MQSVNQVDSVASCLATEKNEANFTESTITSPNFNSVLRELYKYKLETNTYKLIWVSLQCRPNDICSFRYVVEGKEIDVIEMTLLSKLFFYE